MKTFSQMVSEQMKTMEKLLYLQAELERCQEIEAELQVLQNETELESIQNEIRGMKAELKDIQIKFEEQTEEVIRSYQLGNNDVKEVSG
ncbi:YgaB family protein [Neobacillus sp. YIM B06451]|uniref:YgaB family protein n=1 Tax=Neobacillus sp. YIM B06451 TaxID=3070994 RepID=UPI00292EA299|nr:YgaB family protein [Neobacillus sp. YIM B06451]